MSRVNVGRTFADRDRPDRWYVVLVVNAVYALVWWDKGKPHSFPLSERVQRNVRLDAYDFPMNQLLARWGITTADLDAFLEASMYRWDDDVKKVRATRKPLTGRTIEHVKHKHRGPDVGGS